MERINPNDLHLIVGTEPAQAEPPSLTPILNGSPTSECVHCGGVGYLSRGPVRPHEQPVVPCVCTVARQEARQHQAEGLQHRARLSKLEAELGRLKRCLLDDFDLARPLEGIAWEARPVATVEQRKALKHAYAVCRAYADTPAGWLYLYGPPGAGKSHLLAGVSLALASQGLSVAYASVPDVLDFLRDGYGQKDTGGRLEALRSVDFLALDDLGAEHTTSWGAEKLFMLLNDRYLEDRPTGITSNVHPDDFEPGARRLASRIAGLAELLWLPISDYRRLR
jgi:DNA replication protein DnaC